MARKRGRALYKVYKRPKTIEFPAEGTTVVAVVSDFGAHITYEIRENNIVVWSRIVYRESEDVRRKDVAYEQDVIADYLAHMQEPSLHGNLFNTVSGHKIAMKFDLERRQTKEREAKNAQAQREGEGVPGQGTTGQASQRRPDEAAPERREGEDPGQHPT